MEYLSGFVHKAGIALFALDSERLAHVSHNEETAADQEHLGLFADVDELGYLLLGGNVCRSVPLK
jgi:hypothetical protein